MAVLSDQTRLLVRDEVIRRVHGMNGVVKANLSATVNAIDSYIDTNAAAMNTAIPQPARGALSNSQKSQIIAIVMAARYEGGL